MRLQKLLVANRGEIALRVFRACRGLGIATVAVAPPDDAGSLHARSADVMVEVSSYLDPEEHIRAAKETGAEAIHPGYGFLAESPQFAAAVEAAALLWVGPSAETLRAGGDKLEAKRIAREAGVPVVPEGEPAEIGFPLMIKAAAGGGGRGMRVVREPGELEEALAAARREAKAAFGDERVFCERYVERPRHVEVQVLGDSSGEVVGLGERECSVQRRHQKVLEESPSPALDPELRARMSTAAAAFARAIGYRSAGTVEFMLDGREFCFLELNGRIQVEHPVTELVTGVDLVEAQLRIAQGEPLRVADGYLEGHAVEVRLYAEDPRTFLPQSGRIERLRLPNRIRVDAGVEEGDEVGTEYDPLIAKLIAHGATRGDAVGDLRAALAETEVAGVVTNLPFLRWLVAHPALAAGRTTTAFLTEYPPLSAPPLRLPDGPWVGGFRLNLPPPVPVAPPDPTTASHDHGARGEQSKLTAPMPGTVIRVLVGAGDAVQPRQPLVVLEAMKMETRVVSPYEAMVRAVHVGEGDRVAGGALLIELEE
ncbi:MAG TPA: biotin carboxylase N-terminal domain-containing protein [Candidatus Limnocylindria bacterium]|nr:biotin carboxylase N-terminal domain-containing protein [Candidatus Limnocylindria bacterium]